MKKNVSSFVSLRCNNLFTKQNRFRDNLKDLNVIRIKYNNDYMEIMNYIYIYWIININEILSNVSSW